jgi:hypothetical protein
MNRAKIRKKNFCVKKDEGKKRQKITKTKQTLKTHL